MLTINRNCLISVLKMVYSFVLKIVVSNNLLTLSIQYVNELFLVLLKHFIT